MTNTTERVRELVERSGGSQREFAERVGLDNAKMSKSLNGVRRFTSLDLARIAEAGGVTVDWLLGADEPAVAMAARAATGTSNARALAEAKRLSDHRADVSYLGYRQPWRQVAFAVGSGRYVDQGQRLATAARTWFERAAVDPLAPDLAGAVERAFGIDVSVTDLGPAFDGLAVSNDETKLILVSQSALPWRQRFTIAHELAHILAGDDQGVHLDVDVLDRRGDLSEGRANAFAAALLMPEETLRNAVGRTGVDDESFAQLACRLRVSPSALAYRLKSMRLVDAGACDRFASLTAQSAAEIAGASAAFAADVAEASRSRPPGLLARDTYAAYIDGKATLRPYANLIGSDVDSLRVALERDVTETELKQL